MATNVCIRFGFVVGAWVGFLMALLHSESPQGTPAFVQLTLDGLLIALITALIAAALTSFLARLPFLSVLKYAMLIGAPAGLLLGPLGYQCQIPTLALIVCGVLGILIGLILCRLLCGDADPAKLRRVR
jgi:hypothetical protein